MQSSSYPLLQFRRSAFTSWQPSDRGSDSLCSKPKATAPLAVGVEQGRSPADATRYPASCCWPSSVACSPAGGQGALSTGFVLSFGGPISMTDNQDRAECRRCRSRACGLRFWKVCSTIFAKISGKLFHMECLANVFSVEVHPRRRALRVQERSRTLKYSWKVQSEPALTGAAEGVGAGPDSPNGRRWQGQTVIPHMSLPVGLSPFFTHDRTTKESSTLHWLFIRW